MILNWILLLITAFIAYTTGSISTQRVASRYVFHRDLTKLGKGNIWLSNFRRLFGPLGFVKLALVEILKDLIPLLIGALLIAIRGRSDIGIAFGQGNGVLFRHGQKEAAGPTQEILERLVREANEMLTY